MKTVEIKTSNLMPPALNWAVAMAENWAGANFEVKPYSTDWAHGGPIIEREKISLEWTGEDWMAYIRHDEEFFAPTPLIAAMRCYVASKLGDTVEVPQELTK